MKKMSIRLSLAVLFTGFTCFTAPINAETALDPAPFIQPTQPNGKKVLFDNTHAQTAGAADWVIDGGFSDFADGLGEVGYYVKELRKVEPITLADLQGYDVFVIPEANVPYKVSEQQAIADYVSQGGAVFYIGDHYNADRNKNRIDSAEVFNGYRRGAYHDMTMGMTEGEKNSAAMQDVVSSDWLSDTFGVRFRYNALDNLDSAGKMIMDDAFNILTGIDDVSLHAGATLAITDPNVARGIIYVPEGLTQEQHKWRNAADEGVYNGGGVEEGPYVAIGKKGKGKSAFLGDSSLVEDSTPKYRNEETGRAKRTYDGYIDKDNAKFLLQLMEWLSDQEDYETFNGQNITLSNKTVLHDFEDPAKSTEPQQEPWALPQAHYKWYDTTTFAKDSFGFAGKEISIPQVKIEHEAVVAGEEAQIHVKFTGQKPNTVLKGYSLGAYTPTAQQGYDQGAQVAVTKVGDRPWKDKPGYSDSFDVTTDENGNAEQIVTIKVPVSGSFNIRLKQGRNNVVTQPLKVEEGTTEIETPKNPQVTLAHADALAVGRESQVLVKFTDQEPNTVLSGYTLDVYTPKAHLGYGPGGQFAVTKVGDQPWKEKRGASDSFDVKTDENGQAEQLITIRVTDAGSFNIRLKQAREELVTQPLKVEWYLPN